MVGGDRGQALTLEAITSALILLTAVAFALQMTAVTPLSASTSSQHLENQLQKTGEGVLASADESGALEEAVLYWNTTSEGFHGTGETGIYRSVEPENDFLALLDETYSDRNIAVNVRVHYHRNDSTESLVSQTMVDQGVPSDHAVSSSRTVLLVDDDRIRDSDGEHTVRVDETDDFYAPNAGNWGDSSRPAYNLVRVEVIAWRL